MLLKGIVEKVKEINEAEIQQHKDEFYNLVEKINETVNERLNTSEDIDNAKQLVEKITSDIRKDCLKRMNIDLLDQLKSSAMLQPNEFQQKCDEIFKTNDEERIFEYINDPDLYSAKL